MPSGLTKEEINRKLLHGLAVLPMGVFYGSQLTGQTQLIVSIFFLYHTVSLLSGH